MRKLRSPARRRATPVDIRYVSSESVLPDRGAQVGSTARAESYLVHGADRSFLGHTTYTFAATAKGYRCAAAVWAALRTQSEASRSSTRWSSRASRTTTSVRVRLHAPGLLPRGQDVRARHGRRDATPQTRQEPPLTVIGVLSDTAPLAMARHLDVADDARGRLRRTACVPTVHSFAAEAGRRPRCDREGARVRVPRERHAGRRVEEACSPTPSRRASPSTA